jgi:RNA polymerase sigma-70 factor (family 1)
VTDNKQHIENLSNRKGLPLSLKDFFFQYYSSLCFFAEKIVQDQPAAEDIVQDTFVKLWQKQPDFSGYRNIKAVLYIAVKNACVNFIKTRRRSTRKKQQWGYLLLQETATFALTEIVRTESIRQLHEELQKLPPECRNVMQLLFVEGWDNKKVATHLDIAVSTVRNHRAKGIQLLRKKLGIFYTLLLLLC